MKIGLTGAGEAIERELALIIHPVLPHIIRTMKLVYSQMIKEYYWRDENLKIFKLKKYKISVEIFSLESTLELSISKMSTKYLVISYFTHKFNNLTSLCVAGNK